MKSLDIRTMMVMVSILSLLFSGLLAFAGMHSGTIRGMRYWALASLILSISMGLAIIQPIPTQSWSVVIGSASVFISAFLQLNGIKAFKEENFSWLIPGIAISAILIMNIVFVIIYPNINARVITNSISYCIVTLICAHTLLIRIAAPLRTAYWFTGSIFLVLSLFSAIRGITFLFNPPGEFSLYGRFIINPVTFFIASFAQLCLTFGFVLMLNYRLASDLQALALTDILTGAKNRRSLEQEAEIFESLLARTGDHLAVMFLDVDHFKLLNDNYGHVMGDIVLKQLSTVAKTIIREYDCFARYGGEEFCILLPSTSESEALLIAERLRLAYAAAFQEVNNQPINSTISIGVADSSQVGLTFAALSKAADQAMYHAKQAGRNRVIGYSTLASTHNPET